MIDHPMSLIKQITTKTSLLNPYEQFYIQSLYYHKEHTRDQNTGENDPLFQLIFTLHIAAPPPPVYTDQNFDTLPTS